MLWFDIGKWRWYVRAGREGWGENGENGALFC